MSQFDTIIKNGTIVDGTRVPRYRDDEIDRDWSCSDDAPERGRKPLERGKPRG